MSKAMSIAELKKYVDSKIAIAMEEVAEVVKDEQQRQIDEVVYKGYQPNSPDGEPWVHERRRDKGGLRDRSNMIESIQQTTNGVELSVKNTTTGKDDDFEIADLVEYGDKYNGKEYTFKKNRDGTAWQYLRGRPFTTSTVEELKHSGRHVDALEKGLERQGIKVE